MRKHIQFISIFIVILVAGVLMFPAISSAFQVAAIVPLEYKYITFSSTASKAVILNKLNTEGQNGWESFAPVECEDLSCGTYRLLLKRPK